TWRSLNTRINDVEKPFTSTRNTLPSRRERAVFSAGERYRKVLSRLSIPAVTKDLKGISGLLSELITTMQRHNTCRQVVIVDTFESSILHHSFQGVLIGMHADRFSKITVAVSVVRDQ